MPWPQFSSNHRTISPPPPARWNIKDSEKTYRMWCTKYNSDKNVVLISCLVDAAVLKYTIYTPISGVRENKMLLKLEYTKALQWGQSGWHTSPCNTTLAWLEMKFKGIETESLLLNIELTPNLCHTCKNWKTSEMFSYDIYCNLIKWKQIWFCLLQTPFTLTEKRDTFPVSKKNKTLDHGFGLCVCTTSKRVEKCRQLGAKPPH